MCGNREKRGKRSGDEIATICDERRQERHETVSTQHSSRNARLRKEVEEKRRLEKEAKQTGKGQDGGASTDFELQPQSPLVWM